MHPDEAVHLALHELRSPHGQQPARPTAVPHVPSPGRLLLDAYAAAWRWYVQDGRTPPQTSGTEAGHLPAASAGRRA